MKASVFQKVVSEVLRKHREVINQELYDVHEGCSCGDRNSFRKRAPEGLSFEDASAWAWSEHVSYEVTKAIFKLNKNR